MKTKRSISIRSGKARKHTRRREKNMKQLGKRLVGMILCAAMAIGMLPGTGLAAENGEKFRCHVVVRGKFQKSSNTRISLSFWGLIS